MFCTNCGKEIPDESKFCKFCGTKTKEKKIQTQENKLNVADSKLIKVTFQRKKSFVGCAVSMKIHVDGKVVAVLKNGAAQQVEIPSGKHKVIVEVWSAVSETEVEFSPEYSNVYVLVGLKMGLITNKTKIISIRNEK